MQVFGAGVGRTGTMSLRMALEELGFGPCYHMEVVLDDPPKRVPQWNDTLAGQPDWSAIYEGMQSAVDWPTASFYKELHAAYPDAPFILTHRDPETWEDSFGETIYTAMAGRDQAPPEVQPWLDMCIAVVERAGIPMGLSRDELISRFLDHMEAVKAAIPERQLLLFQVKEGWEPLCEFLGVDVPGSDFPRSNNREEFWELIS